ncbi:hypothetical protein AMIS_66760 [Actinoplanes missouriensis 431]|uniref:Uncharacterized protein n=1 Tax=Actinoplanes missouriensis (strain ATCC 14538 / DSM 43046 / CBS 188.64 / JCM 3121 / NBRC 102363 / NCIMB 12654 / NRRL B-3342 / UNCC 431) TaxID=512565 RepID=I0HFV9_ACTM4|nr:hypothetical protein AMIS_66760 [Actinoplanes missouriensis 431]
MSQLPVLSRDAPNSTTHQPDQLALSAAALRTSRTSRRSVLIRRGDLGHPPRSAPQLHTQPHARSVGKTPCPVLGRRPVHVRSAAQDRGLVGRRDR